MTPAVEGLEPRVVLSASTTSSLTDSIAQAAVDDVGVKQLVVETWKNVPYLFMINADDMLYYGHMVAGPADSDGNTGSSFSGWTFLAGSAEKIAVDVWNDSPYIYLIDTNNDLSYGDLSATAATGEDAFSGWHGLTWGVKDVSAVNWQDGSYLYITNTNNELYYGNQYNATYPAFSGWTYVSGDVKTVAAERVGGDCFLYMVDMEEDLYYGYMGLSTNAPASPFNPASFTGWGYVAANVKKLAIPDDNTSGRSLRIYASFTDDSALLYTDMSLHTDPVPYIEFANWSYAEGQPHVLSVVEDWANAPSFAYYTPAPVYFTTGADGDLSYGYDAVGFFDYPRPYYDSTVIADDSKQTAALEWQGNPYVFRIDSTGGLSYGDVYARPTNGDSDVSEEVVFSGWNDLPMSPGAGSVESVRSSLDPPSTTPAAAPSGAGVHIPLGDGVGVQQLVVETWKDQPYLFMINTNNELYYGHMIAGPADAAGNTTSGFSGWTFLLCAAKEIAVDVWNGSPYIYLINAKDDLYFGDLYKTTDDPSAATGQDAFSGWHYLAGGVDHVSATAWQGQSYLYVINTNNQVYFSDLYNASYYTNPSVVYPAFSGWSPITGVAGDATSVSIGQRDGACYLYVINADSDAYLGFMTLPTNAPASPINPASFSSWYLIQHDVKSVVVSPAGFSLIYNPEDVWVLDNPPQSLVEYHVNQVSDTTWTNEDIITESPYGPSPIYFETDSNGELSYRYWITVVRPWDHLPITTPNSAPISEDSRQTVAVDWQGNPYVFRIDSTGQLTYGDLYVDSGRVPAFCGWSAI